MIIRPERKKVPRRTFTDAEPRYHVTYRCQPWNVDTCTLTPCGLCAVPSHVRRSETPARRPYVPSLPVRLLGRPVGPSGGRVNRIAPHLTGHSLSSSRAGIYAAPGRVFPARAALRKAYRHHPCQVLTTLKQAALPLKPRQILHPAAANH